MILLDTDTISLVQRIESPEGLRIRARAAQLPTDELLATTIVTYEEQMRGWFLRMSRARSIDDQIVVYDRMLKHVINYRKMTVVPFDRRAADEFVRLKSSKLRVGTSDLKIAAIALSLGALLVTRNLGDFQNIPKLRVEDWAAD